MSRRVALAGLILFGVAALGAAAFWYEARPERSPVGRGEQLARAAGCFACHGYAETDHRTNARRASGQDWRTRSIPTLWENGIDEAAVVIEWITEGCPPDERERHQQLHVQMRAYGDGFLKPDEIDAIAAWILAQGLQFTLGDGGDSRPLPQTVADVSRLPAEEIWRHGDALSRKYGCYQCHGELGQGGVSNPASFKDYIPGFFGSDFRALTDDGDRAEIAHWIEHGRGKAIEAGAAGFLAKRYFDAQAIGMPAYQSRLTPVETAMLVEYLLLLNETGPLSAAEVEATARRLTTAQE